MKSNKIIAGTIIGTVVALVLIPKTRKMLAEAVNNLADTLKDARSTLAYVTKDTRQHIK